jgi:hypothetical protein
MFIGTLKGRRRSWGLSLRGTGRCGLLDVALSGPGGQKGLDERPRSLDVSDRVFQGRSLERR